MVWNWLKTSIKADDFKHITEGLIMILDQKLNDALVACAEAELNRPLKPNERDELVVVYKKNEKLSVEIRVKTTIDEFCKGRTRYLTDSVSSSDNVGRKLSELLALLNGAGK